MTTVIGTRIHQLEMLVFFPQLQFIVGSLQEGRIPVDCLHNMLRHFGAFEVCRVTAEVGSCSFGVRDVENLLAKTALLKTPSRLAI